MASAFAGIEIGKRSLDAHNQSITTAGHNITNAGTEGYSRQRVQVKTFEPIYRPDLSRAGVPGQIGQGAVAESVNRVRDEMLDQRITAQTNQESFWATREKYRCLNRFTMNRLMFPLEATWISSGKVGRNFLCILKVRQQGRLL